MTKPPVKPTAIESFITWIGSVPSLIFHSLVFLGFFILTLSGILPRDLVLLVWNTIVSLEAIYLAIFIQFSVNRNTQSLREVEEDIDEIQEDVEELGEDVDEIQEDIEEISEDIEELSEEDQEEEKMQKEHASNIDRLTDDIRRILTELETMKKR
jgi:septal ring factor EnvC (AmiA/AmiB activator)